MRGSPLLADDNRGNDGQANHRSREVAGAGRAGDACSPGGHGARPPRRQHHGIREAVQRENRQRRRHGDARRRDDLQGPHLHVCDQDAACSGLAQEGSGHREGLGDLQPGEGRQGHARSAQEDRRAEDAGPERDRSRRRDQHDRGYGAFYGPRGGGLMRTHGKKYRAAVATIEPRKLYAPAVAVEQVKQTAYAKFDESVDVAVRLGVDPKHADQIVRGTVSMPHGTGKTIRVLVIAQGEKIKEAEAAGADFVGVEYVQKIKEGWMDTDVIVATPDVMGQLGALGKILGPRGLMPNPKAGTVTTDVTKAVKELKAGKIEFRVDKSGIVHAPIGKRSFAPEALEQNLHAFMEAVVRAKPAAAKGHYIRSVTLSSTMGPGVPVDQAGFA